MGEMGIHFGGEFCYWWGMPIDVSYVHGKLFCVVFVNSDHGEENLQMKTMHGRAFVDRSGLKLVQDDGGDFAVPSSAYNHILPSDGTPILGDCEYYVIVRVSGMDL